MTRVKALSVAGWPAAVGEAAAKREAEVKRQFAFLLRTFTPRTVFMEVGSFDGELALRAASYVERVWCIDPRTRPVEPPCNVRCGPLGGVPLASIDVAFSERFADADDLRRLLAPGGVWFIYGRFVPAAVLHAAGFSRVRYCAAGLRLPAALARVARNPTTAAYR